MHARRAPDGAELRVDRRHDLLFLRSRQLDGGNFRGILHNGKRDRDLSLEGIGDAHHRDFGDIGVGLHRFLDLPRAEPMAGDIDHVVGAAENEVIAVPIPDPPVESRIDQFLRERGEIGFDETLVVTPDRGHTARR